jgi:hypothetical protein
MKTNSQTKCANCKVSYSQVEQGIREYFIPWGAYFLCDACHRQAVIEALQTEGKKPPETPRC